MKTIHSNYKNYIARVMLLAIILTPFSCAPPQPKNTRPTPDVTIAPVIRDQMAQGRIWHKTNANKIDAALLRLTTAQPLKLLIGDPYVLPVAEISATQLASLTGLYTENPQLDGDFSKFNAAPDVISVVFNSGIDVSINGFEFNQSAQLISFSMAVSFSAKTPPVEQVSMSLIARRRHAISDGGKLSTSRSLSGKLTFYNDSSPTVYTINRRSSDWYDSLLGTYNKAMGYPIDIPGKGVDMVSSIAFLNSYLTPLNSWIGYSIFESYSDYQREPYSKNEYSATVELLDISADVTEASYGVSEGNVIVATGQPDDEGRVLLYDLEYAVLSGGPITCSLTSPAAVGIGDPIKMQYIDGYDDVIMPGDSFSCARLSSRFISE